MEAGLTESLIQSKIHAKIRSKLFLLRQEVNFGINRPILRQFLLEEAEVVHTYSIPL